MLGLFVLYFIDIALFHYSYDIHFNIVEHKLQHTKI